MISLEKSSKLHQESCRYIPMGVSSGIRKWSDPLLFIDHADGPYYVDVDGNQYVDHTLGWGPLIVGSNHPEINKAVSEQITKGYTFGAQHQLEIDLAKRMVEILPGVDQVTFSNTGTEAIQSSLRIARAKTGKTKILKFEGHYHGWMNNVLVSFHPDKSQLGKTSPSCGGQPPNDYADTLTLPWNDVPAVEKALEKHGDDLACVVMEPLLANSGCCEAHAGYLQGVVDLCREKGVVSIFDEVITGFRLALGGAREYFGVQPDLSVYAKAMAGGFTMSAIGGRREMFDVLRDGTTIHAGTYNGSSFNLAAALATISILSREGCYEKMHAYGYAVRKHLEAEAARLGIPLITCGAGSVFGVHMGRKTPPQNYEDTLDTDKEMYKKFHRAMLENGVHLLPDGRWYVGASHTPKDLNPVCAAITQSLNAISPK
ncbi:MAG: aspartate aminotransferase family protein [Kiritimatiellia bacterium]